MADASPGPLVAETEACGPAPHPQVASPALTNEPGPGTEGITCRGMFLSLLINFSKRLLGSTAGFSHECSPRCRGDGHTVSAHLAGNKWPPFEPTNKTLYTQTGTGARRGVHQRSPQRTRRPSFEKSHDRFGERKTKLKDDVSVKQPRRQNAVLAGIKS